MKIRSKIKPPLIFCISYEIKTNLILLRLRFDRVGWWTSGYCYSLSYECIGLSIWSQQPWKKIKIFYYVKLAKNKRLKIQNFPLDKILTRKMLHGPILANRYIFHILFLFLWKSEKTQNLRGFLTKMWPNKKEHFP